MTGGGVDAGAPVVTSGVTLVQAQLYARWTDTDVAGNFLSVPVKRSHMDTNADMTVQEVMNREYVAASEPDALVETVELLLREDAESAVVQRGHTPVGVLTQRDVLAALVEGPPPSEATVAEAMTESVPTADATRRVSVTAMETAPAGVDRAGDTFQDQSLCEGCGSLAGELVSFNGQVLCPECRSL